MPSMPRIISLTVIITLIVFLGITFFNVIAPFLLPLFLAGVVALITQPLHDYFLMRTNRREHLAAGLTTASILAGILVPLVIGLTIASVQLFTSAQDTLVQGKLDSAFKQIRSSLQASKLANGIASLLPGDIDTERLSAEIQVNAQRALRDIAEKSVGIGSRAALGLVGGVFSGIIGVGMFTIALYYFLKDGPTLLKSAEGLIPVHVDYQHELLQEFNKVVRAVVVSTFLAATAQALATAALLYTVGFQQFFLIFALAALASLIPIAGTWLVWGPCVIYLLAEGHWGQATAVTLIGAVVIGMLDNVIRSYVLHSDAKLHPLLAFVSVLGGLQVMGLWGVFIGPIVASILHALMKIFNEELQEFSRERQSLANSAVAPVAGALSDAATNAATTNETPKPQPAGSRRKNRRR